MRGDKVVAELPTAAHLNHTLRSVEFLKQFRAVDHLTRFALYQDDFSLASPGYTDGGDGKRLYYLGQKLEVSNSIHTIRKFLAVMDFASKADLANTVAAGLTVRLRHLFRGHKPIVQITATKSHAGKGTLTDFIRGPIPKADILYESLDWPMQSQFQRQVSFDPEIGVICFDNVRLDSAGGKAQFIRSAWIESFVTSPEVMLASPDAGEALRLQNTFVVVINTNDGALSPDLLNRALPIQLAPRGDIQDRKSPIGNPKLEFLPKFRDQIEAEFGGMIERWRLAGCPLDNTVKHPMSVWARTIGGILAFNGFTDFLANYQMSRVVDDPIREALAILAGARPGEPLTPADWAGLAVEQGLGKMALPFIGANPWEVGHFFGARQNGPNTTRKPATML
ncbi:MAG: hypothetical protein L0Y71_26035, partial [Gemmataceae bacterium]|nr:hypothetical protein [Gemmataceae bacterium]